MTRVDSIKIPAEVFKQLKKLHYKDRMLKDMLQEKFNKEMMDSSVEINILYNDIKTKITHEYVPEQYQSEDFTWSADFYAEEIVIFDNRI